MRKIFHTVFVLTLLFFSLQSNAQITIGTVDPGPYTSGSTIAATFTLGTSSCLQVGNKFELYLSNASGDFSSPTLIGSYTGFYATFVNGLIPANTPAGTGYRIRIKSTLPVLTNVSDSAPFEIKAGTAVKAAINATSTYIISTSPLTFGSCNSTNNTNYRFANESTAANVTAIITNELNPGAPTTLTYTTTGTGATQAFPAALAHYTIFVKAVMLDGTVGTQAYFLINNLAVTNFTTTSSNTVCYPTGSFEYLVDVNATNGIKLNFPGNTYNIDWGDGTSNIYTFCDIRANDSKLVHTYTKSSCGLSFVSGTTTTYNAFGINVRVASPFCGPIGTPLATTAIVITRPENAFAFPKVACLGDNVVFLNQSTAGQKPNSNAPGCTGNLVLYTWYVDDVEVAVDKPITFNLEHIFTTVGTHKIRLSSASNGGCQAEVLERTICIQLPPQPLFTLPANTICLSSPTLIPANNSVIDNSCTEATVTYTWAVSPVTGVSFNAALKTPTFTFSKVGVYQITLKASSGTCSRTTAQQEVVVNTVPQITMSPDISLCTPGAFVFGPTGIVTKTSTSGTSKALSDTYTWMVTSSTGAYNFVLPSGPNTQYPTINFADFATYTVTLVHKNGCATVTQTQVITFSPSPVPTIIVNPNPICYDAVANLEGAISNTTSTTTFVWRSTGGGTFSNPTSLTTTYTPTAAERDAGTTNITLFVTTGLVGTCSTVSANIDVLINPNNVISSAAAKTICTGTPVAYVPASSVAGSTFSWTAVNADGNAAGYTASGTGNIDDIITNNNATNNAVVVYTIIPLANGCQGVPFTFTVTVTPNPVITAIPANATICTGSSTAITLSSNITGTTYSWTSVASAGISGNTNHPVASAETAINETLLNSTNGQGSVTYTITPISANGCPGAIQTVTIFVDPAVTIANAGADESICDIDNYKLDGNPATVGTGLWTLTSGQTGVGFGDATNPQTTISGLMPGQVYTFSWTISAPGACAASTDAVNITVNTPTVAGVTAGEATVCFANNTGTITLTGNIGTVEGWQSSTDNGITWTPVPVANTTNTLTYTNLTVSTAYRAVVKNGGCDIKYSNSTLIIVTPATTVAAAGADQSLCNELSTVLDGNTVSTANGETGLWTLVSGNPNVQITDPTLRNTTVTNLVAGVDYIFRWTITGTSACGPTADEVTIHNQSPLTNTISSTDAEVCNGKVITITGTTPTGGSGTYTYVWESSTDGISFTTISGETGKDLSYPLTTTLTFRRTVSSGACTQASNVIRIIAQAPLANNTIAADQEICAGSIPTALTGSTATGSDGNFNYQWQSSTNGTTWVAINSAVLRSYTPPALTVTTYYRRVVSTITCSGALQNISATVKITVKENAKAEYTYVNDNNCSPFYIDAQNIQAVPYPDRNATYTWYADGQEIGTDSTFPGYPINESSRTVVIKLTTTSSLGCTSDSFSHAFSTKQTVTPSFTQNTMSGCGPLVVTFVNTSTSLTTGTFKWNFGDGQSSTQTIPPAITFLPNVSGRDTTYIVTLTSLTGCGESLPFTSTVLVKAKPIAKFSPSSTKGCSPMKVTFRNTSPGTNNTYIYDFGDGKHSDLLTDTASVEHIYTTSVGEEFIVTLLAQNDCDTATQSFKIIVSPNTVTAELVVNGDEQEGCAPFNVKFYNNSTGANKFTYDYGDGTMPVTKFTTDPVNHTFTKSGIFTVTMTASNGCSELPTTEQITVFAQPVVDFTANVTSGCADLPVQFKNNSTDAVSYSWDFGDGSSPSDEFEPLHTYTGAQEYYTVTLTATNSLGCPDTTIMKNYIHIVPAPVAIFNVAPSNVITIPTYTFRFEDESSNNPVQWEWTFGDGNTSTLQNPSHSYLDTGTYKVTLKVTNAQGCFSSTFQNVTITGVPGYLYIANSFIPGSDYLELRDFRAKGSGIKNWKMSVFNKWGQTLWETTKLEDGRPAEGWDGTFNGTPQPQGVYFWKIDVEFVNGSAWKGMTYDKSAPKKTGAIHLIR